MKKNMLLIVLALTFVSLQSLSVSAQQHDKSWRLPADIAEMTYEVSVTKADGKSHTSTLTRPIAEDGSWLAINRDSGARRKIPFDGSMAMDPRGGFFIPRLNLPALPCESLWARLSAKEKIEAHNIMGQRLLLHMLEFKKPHGEVESVRYGFNPAYGCTPLIVELKRADGAFIRHVAIMEGR
jgi:hypothetical protein